MGFNIAGLVLDKNYQNDLESLEQILNQKLVFEEEVDFESASENWKEDDYCDICFTPQGTLVFLSMTVAAFEFLVPKQKAFSFVLSEMSMTFTINYTRNKFVLRTLIETEGEVVEDVGSMLDFEETESDKAELIYHMIEELLGVSFWDIDDEVKCYRYALVDLPSSILPIDTAATKEPEVVTEKAKEEEATFFGKVLKGLGIK